MRRGRRSVARIELMEEIVGGTVLFGDANTEPLLRVTALESLGIEVDPLNQQLKKLPAVRLKSLRTRMIIEKGERDGTTAVPGARARSVWKAHARDGESFVYTIASAELIQAAEI